MFTTIASYPPEVETTVREVVQKMDAIHLTLDSEYEDAEECWRNSPLERSWLFQSMNTECIRSRLVRLNITNTFKDF